MPPLTWKVDTVRATTSAAPDGSGFVKQRVITYHVGTQGPFELVVNEADYTGENVARLLDEQAAHLNRLMPGG